MAQNIHGTTVDFNGAGILIIGKSGSGKSDLALRLIENKKACLVSDDQTILERQGNHIRASAPKSIAGLLEVRGLGIMKYPAIITTLHLVVEVSSEQNIERLPMPAFFDFEGVALPLIKLNAFEASAPDKVVVKLKAVLEEKNKKE